MSEASVRRLGARSCARLAGTTRRTRLALLGALAAIIVWTIANAVFPYHTINHDEGVYLQQAAMLLDGQLFLRPPVEDAFRPWFFVESPGGLYPKYNPVPAAMFAVGKLLGGYRIALALIAAGTVVLAQRVVAAAFDDRTGYVAAVLFLASPLFLVDASVFLPYVPTTFWNLAFAAAYFRADRTGSRRFAALAGLAVGVAFFARPYTAVLFALPFVAHALWTMRAFERATVERQLLTAAGGLLGVAVALGYNALVTGDPLVFPYEAFAPLDGLGFGRREILGYAREYTIELAIEANGQALWLFATRWMTAGVLGTLLAVVGVGVALSRGLTARQGVIAGVAASVSLGNLYFWGTLNALGDLSDPGEGLAHFLGPYYHVDLLLPLSAFAAVGIVAVASRVRGRIAASLEGRDGRRAFLAVVLVLGTVGTGAAAVVAAEPLSENATVTEKYEQAYEPFEERSLDDAVVFMPTPYGDWLNHPFQAVRNDPDYDRGPVYALQERQFDVLDGFPDRQAFRYVYHGNWNPGYEAAVTPHLQRVRLAEGERVRTDVSMSVPAGGERLLVTVAGDGGSTFTSVPAESGRVAGAIVVENATATLRFEGTDEQVTIPVDERDRLTVRASVDTGTATSMTYGLELPVERTDGRIRALTPALEVCYDQDLCGGEAAYVPGTLGDHVDVTATVEAP